MERSFLFVTGGVCSSLGKGIVAASTAAILKSAGKKVSIMKLDPYLNVDPGTMSPFQHGEVFVLDDGAETDLDLGHYERFIDAPLQKCSSVTTGKIYSEVLSEERKGNYLGGTIQVVPHITQKIRDKIELAAEKSNAEILVIEIGGTVGDIEAEPFLEVLRQMKNKYDNRCLSLHLTLLPYLAASKELKTKPTQLSVRELRRLGIQPDFIFARSDVKIPTDLLKKVAYFCGVPSEFVIPAETVRSIYEVPLRFAKFKLGELIAQKMDWSQKDLSFDLSTWETGVKKIKNAKEEICIGLAGKYNELDDAYLSVMESIKSAAFFYDKKPIIEWIDTEKIEENDPEAWETLRKVSGVVVPGGFGYRGIEGKIKVAEFCRIKKKPYLGLCLGSQIMAIEFARHVLKINDATSEEFDSEGGAYIVHFMVDQRGITKKGGTMRLGSCPCFLKSDTKAQQLYNTTEIAERHRHRYEFNNEYREQFEKRGFIFSGTSPDGTLIEIVEISDHPFMIGSQFHPEFLSRPFLPHPLFRGFLEAIIKKKKLL